MDYVPRIRRNHDTIHDIPGRLRCLAKFLTEDSVRISDVVERLLLYQPAIQEIDACHLIYLANSLQNHANAANHLRADLGRSHDYSPRPLRRRRTASPPSPRGPYSGGPAPIAPPTPPAASCAGGTQSLVPPIDDPEEGECSDA